jgi:hypothetical protein
MKHKLVVSRMQLKKTSSRYDSKLARSWATYQSVDPENVNLNDSTFRLRLSRSASSNVTSAYGTSIELADEERMSLQAVDVWLDTWALASRPLTTAVDFAKVADLSNVLRMQKVCPSSEHS